MIALELQDLTYTLLLVKSENQAGGELAQLVISSTKAGIEKAKDLITKLLASWSQPEQLQDFEVGSFKAIVFMTYMPTVFDLLSATLKDVTPNMKKKKHESFDVLKKEVIKEMKTLVTMFKDHVIAQAEFYGGVNTVFFSAED
jgi:hypothetical protein